MFCFVFISIIISLIKLTKEKERNIFNIEHNYTLILSTVQHYMCIQTKKKYIWRKKESIDRGQLQWNVMIIEVFHDNVEDQYLID